MGPEEIEKLEQKWVLGPVCCVLSMAKKRHLGASLCSLIFFTQQNKSRVGNRVFFRVQSSGFQNVDPELTASASAGNLTDIQILQSYLRPADSELWRAGTSGLS